MQNQELTTLEVIKTSLGKWSLIVSSETYVKFPQGDAKRNSNFCYTCDDFNCKKTKIHRACLSCKRRGTNKLPPFAVCKDYFHCQVCGARASIPEKKEAIRLI